MERSEWLCVGAEEFLLGTLLRWDGGCLLNSVANHLLGCPRVIVHMQGTDYHSKSSCHQ